MNVRSLMVWCCLLASVAACKTAPKKPPVAAEPQPPGPINVTLRLEVAADPGLRAVGTQDKLANGERLALQVKLTESAYVYVGRVGTDGARAVVFPAEGADHHAYPGGELRIPMDGATWLDLGKSDGREDFFLYASREPIPADKVQAMLQEDAAKARPPPPPAPEKKKKRAKKAKKGAKPEPAPVATPAADARPLTAVAAEGGATVQGTPDLAVVHFVLNHGG